MRTEEPSWFTPDGTGEETNTKTHTDADTIIDGAEWSAADAPQSNQINIVVAALSPTVTGIRVDAIMVSPTAHCPSAG
jgi:hypothetical protein